MQYMLLIYDHEAQSAERTEEQFADLLNKHQTLVTEMRTKGVLVGGNALLPTTTATTLRAQANGQMLIIDGPFAETKEQLGGYYLIDCDNLDEALAWAAKVPATGSIEIRPIQNFT